MKKQTMDAIAAALGVSKVTVHKALTGQKGVGEALRREILDYAERTGYRYRSRPVLKGREFLFLVRRSYFFTENEQFYTQIYAHLDALCRENGCRLTLSLAESGPGKFDPDSLRVEGRLPDGVFTGGELPAAVLEALTGLSLPVLCIDYYSPLYPFYYVGLNNYYDGYRLTHHLIERGHTRIGFIGHVRYAGTLTDKYFGYRKALLDFALPYNRLWHLNENFNTKADYDLHLPEQLPTAFICHCDFTAKKLYLALRFRKIRIPEQVSVVSFDDTELSEELSPRLTSMGLPRVHFASAAFELMERIFSQNQPPCALTLDCSIHERDSVALLRSE